VGGVCETGTMGFLRRRHGEQEQSRCLFCREMFTADVRNRGRQKYCAKARRRQRWQRKPQNQNYFCGADPRAARTGVAAFD